MIYEQGINKKIASGTPETIGGKAKGCAGFPFRRLRCEAKECKGGYDLEARNREDPYFYQSARGRSWPGSTVIPY